MWGHPAGSLGSRGVCGYAFESGTSFSAPLVAGAVTWLAAARPSLDQTQITDLLRYSVRDLGPRGYDPYFGFGSFELGPALTRRAPLSDPIEPNDDVEWINGSRLSPTVPPIHRGRGVTRFRASVDGFEDPADVYRILLPPRSKTAISLRPLFGDPDLELYAGWATTVYGRRGRIADSYRGEGQLDRVGLENPYRRRLAAWIKVYPASAKVLDAGYRLRVR
jgi:hypothetical protein